MLMDLPKPLPPLTDAQVAADVRLGESQEQARHRLESARSTSVWCVAGCHWGDYFADAAVTAECPNCGGYTRVGRYADMVTSRATRTDSN